jgi:hypothetical protein
MSVRPAALACPLALALALTLAIGCAPSDREAAFLARKALLERQNEGLRELIAQFDGGSIVPADRFVIGIHESIVAGLLRAELPLERPLGERFVIRLEQAEVLFQDKFGVITMDGTLHRPATPERRTRVRVHGGLGAVEVDTTTNRLRLNIAIDDIELREAGILESVLGGAGKRLVATRGKELLQDALPPLEVPVGLARTIRVPAIQEGAIALDSLVVPVDLSVERVDAIGHKLWVTLDAQIGEIQGATGGIGVSVGKKRR